jgi:hypothetical protein
MSFAAVVYAALLTVLVQNILIRADIIVNYQPYGKKKPRFLVNLYNSTLN